MRAYSTDPKERLVRAVADDQPMREAARRFGVAVMTVKRVLVQQHCALWAERQGQELSEATMWRAIHRLEWTH